VSQKNKVDLVENRQKQISDILTQNKCSLVKTMTIIDC